MVRTFWLSFADPELPKGTQFLGVAVVKAEIFMLAVIEATHKGINPGGEVSGHDITGRPEADFPHDKLLSRDAIEALYDENQPINPPKSERHEAIHFIRTECRECSHYELLLLSEDDKIARLYCQQCNTHQDKEK